MKLGSNDIGKIYIGSNEVSSVYLGNNLVWSGMDADYKAILDYATTQGYTLPSSGQQTLQNQLVVDLKDGGIWDKLDTFGVFATDGDSDFALIDWIRLTDYTAVNSPTFTTNQGFQGDGVSAYIDTNYNISTDAINFSQDDASFGGWRYSGTPSLVRFMGAGFNTAIRDTNSNVNTINSSTFASSNLSSAGIGLRVLNRTSSSDIQMIVDNTLETATATSQTPSNTNLHLLSRGDGTSFSTSEISISLAGSNLVSERTDLYNALNDYMTSI